MKNPGLHEVEDSKCPNYRGRKEGRIPNGKHKGEIRPKRGDKAEKARGRGGGGDKEPGPRHVHGPCARDRSQDILTCHNTTTPRARRTRAPALFAERARDPLAPDCVRALPDLARCFDCPVNAASAAQWSGCVLSCSLVAQLAVAASSLVVSWRVRTYSSAAGALGFGDATTAHQPHGLDKCTRALSP